MITKDQILAALARRTKEVDSAISVGGLTIQELSRAAWRESVAYAKAPPDNEGNSLVQIDPWYAALFAYGVIGADGQPMFTPDQVMAFPNRDDLWAEVGRVAGEILELSEQGADALKKK